jgi:hypothetical protein
MVPSFMIILPFLAAFVLTLWQYVAIDPKRRILNIRFWLMVGAIVAAISYPVFIFYVPDDRPASWLLFALALFWLAGAYHLFRNMPPPADY